MSKFNPSNVNFFFLVQSVEEGKASKRSIFIDLKQDEWLKTSINSAQDGIQLDEKQSSIPSSFLMMSRQQFSFIDQCYLKIN